MCWARAMLCWLPSRYAFHVVFRVVRGNSASFSRGFSALSHHVRSLLHDVSQFVCFVFLETKLFNKVYFTKHYFHVTFQGKFSFQHHFLIFPSSFKLNKLIAVQASVPKSARNILRPRGGGCPFLRAWVVTIFHENLVRVKRKFDSHSTGTNFPTQNNSTTHYNPN